MKNEGRREDLKRQAGVTGPVMQTDVTGAAIQTGDTGPVRQDDDLLPVQKEEERQPVGSRKTGGGAWFVASVYLIVSVLWILVSDRLVFLQAFDRDMMNRISTIKGWGFVFCSALLIFWLVHRALARLDRTNRLLSRTLDQERALQRELTLQKRELIRQNEELDAARDQVQKKNAILVEYQHSVRKLLYRDDWTSLPNRRALNGYLEGHFKLRAEKPLAVLYMDLDNFKLINDVYGHSFGDAFIRAAAGQLRAALPACWLLYRMGGDEFIYCGSGDTAREDIEAVSASIIRAFQKPFDVGGMQVHGSVSIGAALYPEHGGTPAELLKEADIAMYRAKQSGRNCHCVFSPEMIDPIDKRYRMEEALQTALAHDEFTLVFQPQIEIASQQITGFEALLRWKSCVLGDVTPSQFIPVAESSRHILPIGTWVFRRACAFLGRLNAFGHTDLHMSINVSMLQLLQIDFPSIARAAAAEAGISPAHVDIEVTESVLMESREQVLPVLHLLRKEGFGISLDDFGKGYSSLSYLLDMPITVLKIDKSFIDAIENEDAGLRVLDVILDLGRHLSFRVVAEGVETQVQRDYLAGRGCECLQGYWFSRPLREEDALLLLATAEKQG